jgi:hypothetical protein
VRPEKTGHKVRRSVITGLGVANLGRVFSFVEVLKKVHCGFPGKAAFIFMKKYSVSRYP